MPEHTPTPTPSRAVYGFVLYLSFRIFFIIYVVWAVIPEKYLKAIGITFLPQRHWAITVPIFILTVTTVFAFVIYPSLGLLMTPHIDDMKTIQDNIGEKRQKNEIHLLSTDGNDTKCVCRNKSTCSKGAYQQIQHTFAHNTIPVLKDLEIWDVSDTLHSD